MFGDIAVSIHRWSHSLTRIFMVVMTLASVGCKSIGDQVSLEDHIAELMNDRKYDEVILTIDNLSEAARTNPTYSLYRAQAFCGKAGFDLVTLTSISKRAMKFDEVERAFWRILRPEKPSDKSQINMVKSLVAFAAYMKILESLPDSKDSSRPLLMESLVTLRKIPETSQEFHRKSKAQSFMVHTLVSLLALKKSLRQHLGPREADDLFCVVDANILSAEFNWIMEHLSLALNDAEVVKKLTHSEANSTGKVGEIARKMRDLLADPAQSSPNPIAAGIAGAQSLQCGQ
jgi:hypothetical protein